jgi:ATP-dependent 26S proteasome regulatory subunit
MAALDYGWVQAGLEERRANASTIVCFDTRDPRRRLQAKAFIAASPDYREAELYSFDRWRGLTRLDRASGNFLPVTRAVAGGYDAGVAAEVRDLRSALRQADGLLKAQRTVLFLKDLDAAREEERDPDLVAACRSWAHDRRLLANGSLAVLFAGALGRVLDPLTAGLVALVRPPLGTAQERAAVVAEIGRACEVDPGPEAAAIVRATAGLSIHELRTVLVKAYYRTGGFRVAVINYLKAGIIRRSELLEIQEPDPSGFGSVGGYGAIEDFIRRSVVEVLRRPDRAARFAVPLPRGILLFGPPGTGKTLFARALARESHLPFINLRTENLYAKYLGESGQRFAEAIRLAEQMSPAIVFVDEIDRFGRRQGGPTDSAGEETRRVFNQVLEWLGDGQRQAVIVGTTNRPEDLDEAFIRPGRFDYKMPFLYPGAEARREMLAIHLGLTAARPAPPIAMSRGEIGSALDWIVRQTPNFSGAELEQLVTRAKRRAFEGGGEGLSRADLEWAAGSFRVDPARRQQEVERYLDHAAEFTDDATFLDALRAECGAAVAEG